MTKSPDLAELQNLTVEEIVERLPSLDRTQLSALRDLEAKSTKRKGVLEPLDAAIAAKPTAPAADDKQAPAAPTDSVDALATKPGSDDWKREDYAGPLTIPQAEWRRHNVKPVQAARTK